jgi:hypothetical protein
LVIEKNKENKSVITKIKHTESDPLNETTEVTHLFPTDVILSLNTINMLKFMFKQYAPVHTFATNQRHNEMNLVILQVVDYSSNSSISNPLFDTKTKCVGERIVIFPQKWGVS